MKGRTKKQRRAIGRAIRKIRRLQNRGYDRFVLDKVFKRIIAIRTQDIALRLEPFRLEPLRLESVRSEHDDSVMAFSTMAYAHRLIEASKKKAFALPIISNTDQIYTLHCDV